MENDSNKVLYISPDGILEPLGDSQVLKYLEKLSEQFNITLISYEKKNDLKEIEKLQQIQARCEGHNICWNYKPYRQGKFIISHAINVLNFVFFPILLMWKNKYSIVHIRSYMPGLSIPLLSLIFNFKLLFDIRGFWADEKHDRLGWKKTSLKYLFFKNLEKYLFNRSDAVVTLTYGSKKYIAKKFLKPSDTIHVIRTCVDFDEFNVLEKNTEIDSLIVGYLGSIDTAYDFDKFLYFIKNLRNYNQGIEVHMLTKTPTKEMTRLFADNGLDDLRFKNHFLNRNQLNDAINKFDLLAFCLKENFSIIASMPTKIGESLSCGVPIICNAFNEDIELMLSNENIGEIYNFEDPISEQRYQQLINKIKSKEVSKICNDFAKKEFSLESGSRSYKKIYETM